MNDYEIYIYNIYIYKKLKINEIITIIIILLQKKYKVEI